MPKFYHMSLITDTRCKETGSRLTKKASSESYILLCSLSSESESLQADKYVLGAS